MDSYNESIRSRYSSCFPLMTGRHIDHSRTAAAAAFLSLLVACASSRLPVLQADEPHSASSIRSTGQLDQQKVLQIFKRYCFDCHAGEAPEGVVPLDQLAFSFDDPKHQETWKKVLDVIDSGRMPPEEVEAPPGDEQRALSSWLVQQLSEVALRARREGHRTRSRRLTVEEYNFTMQRLFDVKANFVANLPPDPISQSGFENDSELLGLSPLQMECYLDNARRAVQRYVHFGASDQQPLRYFVELEDLYYTTADRYGTRKRAPQPISLDEFKARRASNRRSPPQYTSAFGPIPPGRFPTEEELRFALPKLHQQFIALPKWLTTGDMIVRIKAAGTTDRNGRFPRMRVEAGITLGDGDSMDTRLLGESDVTAAREEPAVYEFHVRVEDIPTKGPLSDKSSYDKLSVFDMGQIFISNVSRDTQAVYALGCGALKDPLSPPPQVGAHLDRMAENGTNFLYLDAVEIELIPDDAGKSKWNVDVVRAGRGKAEERQIASDFLSNFMRQAYRRPVHSEEIAAKLELLRRLRESGESFEESLQETLAAVLISPHFLFLDCPAPASNKFGPRRPTAHQLASRLSYLMWLSSPDGRLAKLADDGSLLERDMWSNEAERLLDDPRSQRFLDSFCRQWLRLDKFPLIAVNSEYYPEYDDDLGDAMVRETLAAFSDVFRSDASVLELIDSRHAFLNDRLADHYEIADVTSGDLQKVQLPEGSARGGLLTQASLLTMNSDGVDSHPIRRGVWLLDRLLNSPPPPPPPNVPDIDDEDPDFRGLSLKERIALHRQPGACQSCHQKIDPWGIPFESFDATGRWRQHVLVRDQGADRLRPVDPAVQLPDGQQVEGIRAFKHYLHQEQSERFTRAVVHHMLTYALARPLDAADRQHVNAIHDRFAASGYRLRELVLAIVEHDVFRES